MRKLLTITALFGLFFPIEKPVAQSSKPSIEEVRGACEDLRGGEKIGRCLLARMRYGLWATNDKISNEFINQTLFQFAYPRSELRCSSISDDITKDLNNLNKLGVKSSFDPISCDDINKAYEYLYGKPISYVACPRNIINYDDYKKCAYQQYDPMLWASSIKNFYNRLIEGKQDLSVLSSERAYIILRDVHVFVSSSQVESPYHKDLVKWYVGHLSKCDDDLTNDSPAIREEMREHQYSGSAKNANDPQPKIIKISCGDTIKLYSELGWIDADQVKAFAGVPACDVSRPNLDPTQAELRQALKQTAQTVICTPEFIKFLFKVGEAISDFEYRDGVCRRTALGLPITQTSIKAHNYTCKSPSSGKSVCQATMYHYCSAGDKRRQSIDCMGGTFEIAGQLHLSYDSQKCAWIGDRLDIDRSTSKSFTVQ